MSGSPKPKKPALSGHSSTSPVPEDFPKTAKNREQQSFNRIAARLKTARLDNSARPVSGWQPVSLLRRPWRIDQLWWRPGGAVSRRYYRVAPENGPPLTLYQDLLTGLWYRQEY